MPINDVREVIIRYQKRRDHSIIVVALFIWEHASRDLDSLQIFKACKEIG